MILYLQIIIKTSLVYFYTNYNNDNFKIYTFGGYLSLFLYRIKISTYSINLLILNCTLI